MQFLTIPSDKTKNTVTLWLNHFLVLYTFLLPIHNGAKSSMFFVMLVLFLYRRDYWFYLKEAFSNRIVQAFLIFYFLNALGMLYSDNMLDAKSHMDKAKYLIFPLFFLSFLDKRFIVRIITAFILGMLVAEIVSYLIHFGFLPHKFIIGNYEIYKTFSTNSPAPFMAHSDHNVGLSLVVAILLYQLLNKENISSFIKVLSITFMVTATINMSFIASRTGYVLFIFIILVVILLSYKKNIIKMLSITLLLLSMVAILSYNYSNTVNKRVNQTIDSINKILLKDNYNTSVGLRIGFTKYGFEVIKENPIFGVGVGDHMDEVHSKIPEKHKYIANKKYISKPHNVYTQILLQLGLIGLLSFSYLIYTIFAYKDTTSYKKGIMIIITLSTLVFMLPGMFFGSFELPLFVVFISAMIANKEQNINVNDVDTKLIFKYFIFIVLFLIIGITR